MPENTPALKDLDVSRMKIILETWDMSNSIYHEILEKQRKIEEERERQREQERKRRGVWRRIVDTFVPA